MQSLVIPAQGILKLASSHIYTASDAAENGTAFAYTGSKKGLKKGRSKERRNGEKMEGVRKTKEEGINRKRRKGRTRKRRGVKRGESETRERWKKSLHPFPHLLFPVISHSYVLLDPPYPFLFNPLSLLLSPSFPSFFYTFLLHSLSYSILHPFSYLLYFRPFLIHFFSLTFHILSF